MQSKRQKANGYISYSSVWWDRVYVGRSCRSVTGPYSFDFNGSIGGYMKTSNLFAAMAGMAQMAIPEDCHQDTGRDYGPNQFRGIPRGACKSSVKQTSRSKYMPHQGAKERARRLHE